MKEMWNSRYSDERYAYGTAPNVFFKETLDQYQPQGKILLPADGEGRNGVYAAKKGLDVYAFDISIEGKKKAERLAAQEQVQIHYEVGAFFDLDLVNQQYDVAALIYAHFPPPILSTYYSKVAELIRPNGLIMLEGFSKGHLPYRTENPKVGGPANLDFLFSEATIEQNFPDFDILQLEDVEVTLSEGLYHIGKGKVLRFIGRKK